MKRTYREIFLDKLKTLSDGARSTVTNSALRRGLGWDDDRYQQVKDQLIIENVVSVGRGRGETLALVGARKPQKGRPTRQTKLRGARTRRSRRTYRDIFLQKLADLSGDGKSLVANGILRDELDWDEERYRRVKEQLVEEEAVIVGRGHGGMVGLAVSSGSKGLTLFVSYSHADEALKNELMKHIEPLRRLHRIDAWHDRKIKPGDEWEKSIANSLASADIVLLLVSIDFINSKYCYDVELETAMERHAKGNAVVIPVILRSCLWHHTPFAKLQALPKDGKAVTSWPDRDDALATIVDGIRQVAEARLANV